MRALGLDTSNLSKVLDEDERGSYTIRTPGGPQFVSIISESGLYSLVLRSRKPEAKPFRRWVTHDILPSIAKHGAFATQAKSDEVKIFEHNEFGNLRVVERDGETWFVAADVCRALGLNDPAQSVRNLDDDEKGLFTIQTPGGPQSVSIISESGLYSLVLRSRKPEAKPFRRWVTHDILPSIAKHGAYMTPQTIEDILANPDTIIRLATDLKAKREQCALAETKVLALAEPMDSGLLIPSAAGKGKLRLEPGVWR